MKTKILFKEVSKEVISDSATGGNCYNVCISTKEYIKLISETYKESNIFQRGLFDIKRNLVYNKLVRDLLKGVVLPTISLYFEDIDEIKEESEIEKENVRILDGLQRTHCILYAYDLLNCNISDESILNKVKNPLKLEEFLERPLRLEIWTNMTVNGILYKMVSLNAGQTPMNVEHQFEVLEIPLMKALKNEGVEIFRKTNEEKTISNGFLLSLVVEGVIAYNSEKIFPKKQEMAISFLDRLDINSKEHESSLLKTDIFLEDLIWVLKDFKESINEKYKEYKEFRRILQQKSTFFIPLMAALGKARHSYPSQIENRKRELIELVSQNLDDPLNLKSFDILVKSFKSGIGLKTRKLVFNVFNLFFRGDEQRLDWHLVSDLI